MLPAVDVLRGITILWVTLFHMYADIRGVPGLEVSASACLSALRSGEIAAAVATAVSALVAWPSFRVDLLLFVTGLVLMLRPPVGAAAFLNRRMRAVLPSYWLASLLIFVAVVALAAIRAGVGGHGFGAELHQGSLLARVRYLVEPLDLVRSFSLVGRFQDPRTMQVIAPSMWYVVLVLQAYGIFPMLRALLSRLGPVRVLAATIVISCLMRWLVFRYDPFPAFGPKATVIYFLPFRLVPLVAGMVASRWATSLRVVPGRRVSFSLAVPALLLVIATVWWSENINEPGTRLGIIGPIGALLPALPGLWILAAAASAVPRLRRVIVWAGQHSISILVAQDVLRFVVGTAMALGGRLGPWMWWLALPYMAAALVVARFWSPLPIRFGDWVWPLAPAGPRAGEKDEIRG